MGVGEPLRIITKLRRILLSSSSGGRRTVLRRSRIDVAGPLSPYVPGFEAELRRLGYTDSPIKKHLYLLARLSRWLGEQGLDATDVATERVEVFFAARRAAGVANLRTTR